MLGWISINNSEYDVSEKTIGLICGGSSVEHEVALQSAVYVAKSILAAGYSLEAFVISKLGTWLRITDVSAWLAQQPTTQELTTQSEAITPVFGQADCHWRSIDNPDQFGKLDVIVPIIHGKGGEDGALQGLCQFWQLPFVGPNIQDAVITFDKALTKSLVQKHGLPVVPWLELSKYDDISQLNIPEDWSCPLFVKAARGGSSLGVHKVHDKAQLQTAIEKTFLIDDHLIVEPGMQGQEIECAVLIGDSIDMAGPAELDVHSDYYSYKAKYTDPESCTLMVNARLSEKMAETIRKTAKQVAAVLDCQSMARVDFFVMPDESFVINEVNTIPGFTKISMFPKNVGRSRVIWCSASRSHDPTSDQRLPAS